jgi:hypothetical protein
MHYKLGQGRDAVGEEGILTSSKYGSICLLSTEIVPLTDSASLAAIGVAMIQVAPKTAASETMVEKCMLMEG